MRKRKALYITRKQLVVIRLPEIFLQGRSLLNVLDPQA